MLYSVLLTGDFNAHSGGSKTSPALNALFENNKCRDLYGEYVGDGKRVPTYGDNSFVDYQACTIDYVFAFDSIGKHNFVPVKVESVEVVPGMSNLLLVVTFLMFFFVFFFRRILRS